MAERELTQEQIAEGTGVSQGAVSGWLKGSIPKGDVLHRAAQFFGVSMEVLLTGRALAVNAAEPPSRRSSRIHPATLRLAEQAASAAAALHEELKKLV